MVTLQTADKALKDYYLGVIKEQLDVGTNPFLAMIEKTSEDVYGKEIKKIVTHGINGGIASGSESGSLPAAMGNSYAEFALPLKNLYGSIEISDKALRASETGSATAVSLLNAEMNGLIKASKDNFSRMLFGDGTGYLCKIVSISDDKLSATVDDVKNITEGMLVDVYLGDSIDTRYSANRITDVDKENSKIYFTKAMKDTPKNSALYVSGSKNQELTGLGAIFSDSATSLYGLEKSGNRWLNPNVKTVASLSYEDVAEMLDTVEEKGGKGADVIVCSWKVRRILQKILVKAGVTPAACETEGGYKSIAFNGIPVIVDKHCPEGHMYFLNTEDFKICQLCDWQWLDEGDGRILRKIPGKAAYSATLVKYADLLCEKPCGQGLIKGITEAYDEPVLVETVTKANASDSGSGS
ncbi:MAG TPA: phage major capsid protein [Clostridiales bacterium]|nr:phage major capsid protein [Clostridiales bacterium]